jgi:transposase InsO family protein
MDSDDPEDRALEIATFRYRVLAEILEALEEGAGKGVRRAIADAAKRSYVDHCGRATQVTTRTLWRWLAAWRQSGIKGLWPRAARKDRGSLRAFKREILDRAVELRREQPRRATETIVDILEREKTIEVGAVARSTLDRHLDRLGCSRRRLRTLGSKVRRQIRTDRPLELVVTDFHHGPYVVVDDEGTLKRALLCAFLDHFSRVVLEGRYYLREDFVALRFGFRLCVSKHGLMEKLYADNGAAFQAVRFKGACLQLGVRFPHSKPYDAESRGLIERFNGTLKGQFEEEVRARGESPTLTELNAFFEAWLGERYHREPHSEIGEPPIERFNRTYLSRPIPDLSLVDELLRLRDRRTVHRKWSTVEIDRTYYLVDPSLRGRRVDVLHDPLDPAYVLIVFDGKVVERAYPRRAGEEPRQLAPPPEPKGARTDYLAHLLADHEKHSTAAYAGVQQHKPTPQVELSLDALLALVSLSRAAALVPAEHAAVAAFWRKWRPIDPDAAREALEAAARRLGPALHVSVYLDALGALLRKRARKGGSP